MSHRLMLKASFYGIPTLGSPFPGRYRIADVLRPDGTYVNCTLFKDGIGGMGNMQPGNTVLEGLEKEAREGAKG
jgi:hypothetical protein